MCKTLALYRRATVAAAANPSSTSARNVSFAFLTESPARNTRIAVQGRDHLLDSYTSERHPVAARVLENTRAQVALMRPDPLTTSLRSIFADLVKTPEGNRYLGEMMSGVGIRYDLGDDDPRVGTLASDQLLELAGGREERVYDLMTKGGGLFVSPTARALPKNVQHARTTGGPSMLLRPNGAIAWTDESRIPLDDVLARWF